MSSIDTIRWPNELANVFGVHSCSLKTSSLVQSFRSWCSSCSKRSSSLRTGREAWRCLYVYTMYKRTKQQIRRDVWPHCVRCFRAVRVCVRLRQQPACERCCVNSSAACRVAAAFCAVQVRASVVYRSLRCICLRGSNTRKRKSDS